MKNLRTCRKCQKRKIRVELKGRFVNGDHKEWKSGGQVCPDCITRDVKIECTGCGKIITKHFEEQEKCRACHKGSKDE